MNQSENRYFQMSHLRDLIARLVEINVFQLGEFKLKSGALSPIYIDLRGIIAYPQLMGDIAKSIRSVQLDNGVNADVVCGVPYTALPIASIYSFLYNTKMIMKRKEAKDYGTKRMVEGITERGVKCLIIEDVVSSGSSVIETAEVLRKEGFVVTDCIVILNRMQGGIENILKAGIKLHSLFTIDEIFACYSAIKKIEQPVIEKVQSYLKDNSYIPIQKSVCKRLPFAERAKISQHPVAKHLLEIISEKKSNLCVAVDALHSKEILTVADSLGPHICLLKTHIDILVDFDHTVPEKLKALANKHNFLIFEDRKFADIGNTVKHQYESGLYKIQQWADIVTVHSVPGSGILDALKKASEVKDRACVLVAEMSSKGALTDDNYKQKTKEMAEAHPDTVIGFVIQQGLLEDGRFINMCPGVNIAASNDALGQQYKSPEEAVANGADIIIVGRGICSSSDIIQTATEYKTRGYNAYMKNCI